MRTLEKWKKRLRELINLESAKFFATCMPELRHLLGLEPDDENRDLGLASSESLIRLKSIIGNMFQTFAVRNKVTVLIKPVTKLQPCIIALDDLQWSSVS